MSHSLHDKNPLILASSSPRRIELLRLIGIEFRVEPSDIVEERDFGNSMSDLVEGNARLKAENVASRVRNGLIIGADTIVACEGKTYGKPQDYHDAGRILKRLVGKTHQVYTGIAVIRAEDGMCEIAHAITDVTFRPFSESEIVRYLEKINPLDKAGAYAIQGAGGLIVERICGCYYNVVGLPLTVLDKLLGRFGMRLL